MTTHTITLTFEVEDNFISEADVLYRPAENSDVALSNASVALLLRTAADQIENGSG